MRLRAAATALLVLPLLAVPTGSTASAQQAGPPPVQVGNADSGRTVHLVPGQELQVELVAPSAGEQWQGPASTGPLFLTEYAERADRTTSTLEALSVSAGPVVLRARTDRSCFHSIAACPQASPSRRVTRSTSSCAAAPTRTSCRPPTDRSSGRTPTTARWG